MPLLESFNLRDGKKKIYIFGFISKPVNLCIPAKEAGNLTLGGDRKKKKLEDTVW